MQRYESTNSEPAEAVEQFECGGSGHNQPQPARVLIFASRGTRWEERIKAFLRENPRSPRLTVLQNLLPRFLGFPPERRARAWYWVKEQLQAMEAKGVVVCTADENGVALWSVSESPHARGSEPPDEEEEASRRALP